jgi:hypothetical protein
MLSDVDPVQDIRLQGRWETDLIGYGELGRETVDFNAQDLLI